MSHEPNPMFAYGRIDTSAGESGESLHKINPNVFGVVEGHIGRGAEVDGPGDPEAIELADSIEQGTNGQPGAEPTIVVDLGTVDTSGPEGPHTPADEQVTIASSTALGVEPPEPVTAAEADESEQTAESDDDANDDAKVEGGQDVVAGAQTAGGTAQAISTNDGAPDTSAWSKEPEGGYDTLTGEQLKDELRVRGLKVSGSKEELIERLRESNTALA